MEIKRKRVYQRKGKETKRIREDGGETTKVALIERNEVKRENNTRTRAVADKAARVNTAITHRRDERNTKGKNSHNGPIANVWPAAVWVGLRMRKGVWAWDQYFPENISMAIH